MKNVFGNTCDLLNQYCEQQYMKVITGCRIATDLIEIYCNEDNPQFYHFMHRSAGYLLVGKYLAWGDLKLVSIYIQ